MPGVKFIARWQERRDWSGSVISGDIGGEETTWNTAAFDTKTYARSK
jgi:hypothetical protein